MLFSAVYSVWNAYNIHLYYVFDIWVAVQILFNHTVPMNSPCADVTILLYSNDDAVDVCIKHH